MQYNPTFQPYSHKLSSNLSASNPKKPSHLLFTPPGFTHNVFVPFPGRVLPVCARCKKNYKTREHCRNKEAHTARPWADTFMCISLDDTCLTADGKLRAGEFVCNPSSNNAFCFEDGKSLLPKTPSCAQCKDKNYTRTYCRVNKKHRTLPWSTVYVTLTHSATSLQQQEEAAVKDGDENASKKRKVNDGQAVEAGMVEGTDSAKNQDAAKSDGSKKENGAESKNEEETISDAFWSNIHSSRAVLCTVSVDRNEVEWVDVDTNVIPSSTSIMQQQSAAQLASAGEAPYGYGFVMSPQPGMHPGMYPYYTYPQQGASPTKDGEGQVEGQWIGGYVQPDGSQMYAHPMMAYPPYGYAPMHGYGYPPTADGQVVGDDGQQQGGMGYDPNMMHHYYGMQQMHDMNGNPVMPYDPQMFQAGIPPQGAFPTRQDVSPNKVEQKRLGSTSGKESGDKDQSV